MLTQGIVCANIVLVEADDLLEVNDGLTCLALGLQGVGKVSVCLGVIILEVDGLPVRRDRVIQLAPVGQGGSLAELGHRLIPRTFVCQCNTEVEVTLLGWMAFTEAPPTF